MTFLYWSFEGGSQAEDLLLTRLYDIGVGTKVTHHAFPVILTIDPTIDALKLTVALLADGRLVSAALTDEVLSSENQWIAYEWHRRMVVKQSLLSMLQDLDGLRHLADSKQHGLAIFEAARTVEPEKGPEVIPKSTLDGRRVASAARVRENPSEYYGVFADPSVGGANALYAAGLEAARARGHRDEVIIGSPEALGFSVDKDEHSVIAWRQKSVIEAHAVGFSLGSTDEVARLFYEHELSLDLPELMSSVSAWRDQGLFYGIGLILRGLEDPPVVIPTGAVFQQPSIGLGMQNLAAAKSANAMVAAGATVPIILPAWCLNQTLASPSGPMTATPLVSASAGGTQDDVWNRIRARQVVQP